MVSKNTYSDRINALTDQHDKVREAITDTYDELSKLEDYSVIKDYLRHEEIEFDDGMDNRGLLNTYRSKEHRYLSDLPSMDYFGDKLETMYVLEIKEQLMIGVNDQYDPVTLDISETTNIRDVADLCRYMISNSTKLNLNEFVNKLD